MFTSLTLQNLKILMFLWLSLLANPYCRAILFMLVNAGMRLIRMRSSAKLALQDTTFVLFGGSLLSPFDAEFINVLNLEN